MLKGKRNKTKGTTNNVTPFIPEGDFYYTKGVEAFKKGNLILQLNGYRKQ